MGLVSYYTVGGGPGASLSQPLPVKSLGGFASTTPWGGGVQGDLFGIATASNIADGRADFRAIYVYNSDLHSTAPTVRAYLTGPTAGAASVSLGADPRPTSYLDAISEQGVEAGTIYSPPAGVVFSSPNSYATGVDLGDLFATTGHVLWIRRVPLPGGGDYSDHVDLVLEDGNSNSVIRRIYWETSPAVDTSLQDSPPNAVPTPTPFRRILVDYLTAGGSRIMWELDPQLRDPGPYDFQLQFSRSGITGESDWLDVGPPVRDAQYLIDPDQRLWGAPLAHANYRVLLTTASGHYTSDPAPALGTVDVRGWAEIQEVLRKERMMLRQFVGEDGFLLKVKRYGTRCSCVDPDSGEINNSSCPICYGNKFVGGYYEPVPFTFANTTNASVYEKVGYNEGVGTIRQRRIFGRVTGDMVMCSRDVWVSKGEDRRYYVHNIDSIAQLRGIDILFRVEFRLAPRSDVIYTIKIPRPIVPLPYWKQLDPVNI